MEEVIERANENATRGLVWDMTKLLRTVTKNHAPFLSMEAGHHGKTGQPALNPVTPVKIQDMYKTHRVHSTT